MSSYENAPAASGIWKKGPQATTSGGAGGATCDREMCDKPTALDDFFGAGALEAHRPRAYAIPTPPPYSSYDHEVTEKQPETYPAAEEPLTLARMLFMYGFFFFPFWLAGIYILFSPLRSTPDWEAGKTELEKIQLLALHRQTEKKWARRCVYAILSLIVTTLLLVVIIKFGIMSSI